VPVADDKGVVLTPRTTQPGEDHLAAVHGEARRRRPAELAADRVRRRQHQGPDSGTAPIQIGQPQSTAGLQLASTLDDKVQTAAEQALPHTRNPGWS